MKITLHALAEQELEDAVDAYDRQHPRLGDDFAAEIDRVFEELLRNPRIGSALPGDCRRIATRRFSYNIIYSVQGQLVYVVAISHQRRRPDYWRGRI